jgi:hypothetical protein
MKYAFLAGLAVCIPLTAAPQDALAGEESTQGQTFVPADFERFAPRTALDMVSQVPGFTISGSDGSRGFGQAQENVLINGRRISAKSTSARDVLAQIPAENVLQIAIVDGASLDIPGLSGQVANVTTQSTALSGTWTYRQRYRENLRPVFDWFEINMNGERGDIKWHVSLESEPGRGANAGRENIRDGLGNLTQYREEDFTSHRTYVEGLAGIVWEPESGAVANLNAKYAIFENNDQEFSTRFDPDGTEIARSLFKFSEDEWNSEVSGDYAFDLGPGRLKLIGLQRNEHSPTISEFLFDPTEGTNSEALIFERTVDESESILRGEYSWQGGNQSDWQVSLEGALNILDSEAALFEGPSFATLSPIGIDPPEISVEEERAEAFITHGRQLSPKLRLQTSLGAEYSEITSDGPNGQTRKFTRPKGSVSLAWEASDSLTVNTKFSREVGQLNFFDFVSNVDLDDGDNQSGNVDIVPDQTWRLETQFEKNWGDWGAATLTLYGEEIEDIVDQVPIGMGEGPGNLDSATRYGFDLAGTLQLGKLGIEGAQIEYEYEYRWSDVDDPVTGDSRRINDDKIRFYFVSFRHDIPGTDWAYGINFESYFESPTFRLRGINHYEESPPFAWAFIEHKDLWGMTGTAFMGNIFDTDNEFTRTLYSGGRTGAVTRVEDRARNFGPILTLRLKSSF